MPRVVALTTDFGTRDPYVGVMKGVILGLAPDVCIIDVTHEVPPQDVRSGAFVLGGAVGYFPAGTIFVAVVDPGVGSARDPIVVEAGGAWFVAPDNGVLSAVVQECPMRAAWRLTRPEYWRATVSHTFHGRDVFAPVAAHLARGVAAASMGDAVALSALQTLPWPPPQVHADEAGVQILYVDRFGNLVTNLRPEHLVGDCVVRAAVLPDGTEAPLATSYQAVAVGAFVSVWGSFGRLEVSRNMGNAAEALRLCVGDAIRVRLEPRRPR